MDKVVFVRSEPAFGAVARELNARSGWTIELFGHVGMVRSYDSQMLKRFHGLVAAAS